MKGYTEATYGDAVADRYDTWYAAYDPAQITLLAELAQGGPALELGIGTGRVALPLKERGIDVQGIDASEAMVARLRDKPGGADIPLTMGDFGAVPVEGGFRLIYVVFNTFFGLLTQEAQVDCFINVAAHLIPGGVFLIEAFVPDLARFIAGHQLVRASNLDESGVRLDVSIQDPVHQRVKGQQVLITEQGIHLFPLEIRYAWPSEMDLMARLAGLRLRQRWGGWDKRPFTANSGMHVSAYERSEADA